MGVKDIVNDCIVRCNVEVYDIGCRLYGVRVRV